jgi:hypothetical protein
VNKLEVGKILTIAMAIDARLNTSDDNALIAKIEGWYLALVDSMDFEFARDAVANHYQTQTDSLMPAHLNQQWAKESKRLQLEENARLASLEIESARAQRVPMPDYIKEQLEAMYKIPDEPKKELTPETLEQLAMKQQASLEWLKANG